MIIGEIFKLATRILKLKIFKRYLVEKQWSRRQAELFLATQAALLHNDQEKALAPQELQNRISSILKSNPDLAEAVSNTTYTLTFSQSEFLAFSVIFKLLASGGVLQFNAVLVSLFRSAFQSRC